MDLLLPLKISLSYHKQANPKTYRQSWQIATLANNSSYPSRSVAVAGSAPCSGIDLEVVVLLIFTALMQLRDELSPQSYSITSVVVIY